jgi:phenylpropionate dioxygenase-like ring-hydroxylating dioxygenase large terminal subunit
MLLRPDFRTDNALDSGLVAALELCRAPADQAYCVPPACYSDEAILARELPAIFRRQWIGIGRADRFANPGDYEALDITGAAVIVLRDKEGRLRAFANTCRHRGARLLEGSGSCRSVRCPFHAWSYALDGSLIAAPQMEEAKGFDKADHGLVEFRAAEVLGFAFLCLDAEAPDLESQLGNFADIHAPWPLDDLVSTRRRTFEVACNWKAFLDVFNEYYHLPVVHPHSIAGVYAMPEPADVAEGAFASQYGSTEGTGGLLEADQAQALPVMPGLDARVETGVRYSWVFPNMTFAAGRDALWVYEANPVDAGHCAVTQTTCFPCAVAALPDFEERVAPYYHRMDAALEEDIPALENQQRGLFSPHARQGRFSPLLESNVAAFTRWYAGEMLGSSQA